MSEALAFFFRYSDKESDGLVMAAQISEENIDALAKVTHGVIYNSSPSHDLSLAFPPNQVGEIGDYVVAGPHPAFRVIDKEVFEATYFRLH